MRREASARGRGFLMMRLCAQRCCFLRHGAAGVMIRDGCEVYIENKYFIRCWVQKKTIS